MDFRIATTFTDSLARLTGDEQKEAKTTAFDLQVNPANPGMSFHKLARARDKSFWSVPVSRDVGLIVHRTPQRLLLCYVSHHDDAYHWAECRKIEAHPTTGAAQDDEVIPSQQRIASVTDEGDLEDIYNTERHLLYVACTRARDWLWVSGAEPVSEFLADLEAVTVDT